MFNIPLIDIDTQAESHRILNLYTRYMLKKFRFDNYKHYIFKNSPSYEKYYSHINGLLIKAKRNLNKKIYFLNYPPTSCKEIDLIVKRFLYKRYKINIYYNRNIYLKKNLRYKNFRLKFFDFIRDLIFDLRPRECNIKLKEHIHKINDSNANVLILSHDLSYGFDAYKNLPEKLSIYLKKENINTKIMIPFHFGISIYDKLNYLNIILQKLVECYFISFLNLSDYHFIVLEIYNDIYKNKLKKYFLRNKFIFVISSFIDYRYEPLYYEISKELNIKFFNYDYSLGYPFRQVSLLRYLPDTRKFSDIIFANSDFRKEQYKISTNFLNKPPLIFPNICPQSDYSANVKSLNIPKSNQFKIGIVENWFDEDFPINYEDINTLLKLFKKNDLKINFILQSKRGYLEKEFNKLKLNNYSSGEKGDFSKLSMCDIIVSIGWQSTALKAASIFKKPLFFYSRNGFPYENNIFSTKKSKNLLIKKYCKELWLNEKNFIYGLNKIIKDKIELTNVEKNSLYLLNEIGFYENKIESYFDEYFKI